MNIWPKNDFVGSYPRFLAHDERIFGPLGIRFLAHDEQTLGPLGISIHLRVNESLNHVFRVQSTLLNYSTLTEFALASNQNIDLTMECWVGHCGNHPLGKI